MTHLIFGEVNRSLGFGLTSLSLSPSVSHSLLRSLSLSSFLLTATKVGLPGDREKLKKKKKRGYGLWLS